MSKIQEALKKIQGKSSGLTSDDDTARNNVTPLRDLDKREAFAEPKEIEKARGIPFHYECFETSRHLAENPAVSRAVAQEFIELGRFLLSQLDGNQQPVVVMSPHARCGRTYVCVNAVLALTQELEVEVLLVDADVIDSELTQALHADADKGFFDIVNGREMDIDAAISQTTVKGLSFMPIGTSPVDNPRHLDLGMVTAALDRIQKHCGQRVVIVDFCSVDKLPDPAALPQFDGTQLLITAAGGTEMDVVDSAIAKLGGASRVDLVCNQR